MAFWAGLIALVSVLGLIVWLARLARQAGIDAERVEQQEKVIDAVQDSQTVQDDVARKPASDVRSELRRWSRG